MMRWLSKQEAARSLAVPILMLVVATASGFAFWNWTRADVVQQPIAFNHRRHVADDAMACSDCHTYYETGPRSGLPGGDTCSFCHSEPLTESREEARLHAQLQNGEPVVFRKLFHLPRDVYYSHRRHVVAGKLECAECHGAIADTETPPARPLVRITMDFCTGCHERTQVNTDCKTCHR